MLEAEIELRIDKLRRQVEEAKREMKSSPGGRSELSERTNIAPEARIETESPTVRKRPPPLPFRARTKAEAALSTNKRSKHFVCSTSLGPRGGPREAKALHEEGVNRRRKAQEAWSSIRQGRGLEDQSSAHDTTLFKPHRAEHRLGPKASMKKQFEKPSALTSPTAVTHDSCCSFCASNCCWDCDCPCHMRGLSPLTEDKGQHLPTKVQESIQEIPPKTPQACNDKLLPQTNWIEVLLQRPTETKAPVEYAELERSLRRQPQISNTNEVQAMHLFLKSVHASCGSIKTWKERYKDPNEIQAWLSKHCDEKQANFFQKGTCPITTAEGVLLEPNLVARRIRRRLDQTKQRTADLYRRGQHVDKNFDAPPSLINMAFAVLELLRDDLLRDLVLITSKGENVQAMNCNTKESCCDCGPHCWYDCDCACHKQNKIYAPPLSPAPATPRLDTCELQLGQRVEVRPLGVAELYLWGVIACVDEDSFDVHYDDGSYEDRVSFDRLKSAFNQKISSQIKQEVPSPFKRFREPTPPATRATKVTTPQSDAAVAPRRDKGVLSWRRPSVTKKVDTQQVTLEVAKAQIAVRPRSDRGIYAWSKSKRGLEPEDKNEKSEDSEPPAPSSPAESLKRGLRPHVPVPALIPPVKVLRWAQRVGIQDIAEELVEHVENDVGPGAYNPLDISKPRIPIAKITSGGHKLAPGAQLTLALRRLQRGGDYEVAEAEKGTSRLGKNTPAPSMAVPVSRPRPRPDEVEAALAKAEEESKDRARIQRRSARRKRRLERALEDKYRHWRQSKNVFFSDDEESKCRDSISEDSDIEEKIEVGNTQDPSRLLYPRVPSAFIPAPPDPESTDMIQVRRKRALEEMLANRRGPTAYEVGRSLALVEPRVKGLTGFAPTKKIEPRAEAIATKRRAAEEAAQCARSRLLAPQLQHAWVEMTAEDDEVAGFRRTRKKVPVFRYIESPLTPEALRVKRLQEEEVRQTIHDAPIPDITVIRPSEPPVPLLSLDVGRDQLEVASKHKSQITKFNSPTLRKSLKAPLSPQAADPEAARRSLLPETEAARAAFAATSRGEAVGPNGERPQDAAKENEEILDIEPDDRPLRKHLPAAIFGKAPRLSQDLEEDAEREGDVLELDLQRDERVPGGPCFDKAPPRFQEAHDEAPEELWLDPTPLLPSTKNIAFTRAPRFDSLEDDDLPAPTLALSPQYTAVKKRVRAADFSRQPERWDDECHLNLRDEAEMNANAIVAALEAAPLVVEAERAAKGGLQSGVAHAPSFTISNTHHTENSRQDVQGDVLSLSPRPLTSSGIGITSWAKQSDRFQDADRPPPDDGNILCLEPQHVSKEIRGGASDWSKSAKVSNTLPPDGRSDLDPVPVKPRLRNVVNMAKDSEIPLKKRADEGDFLILSPCDRPIAARSDRCVRFVQPTSPDVIPLAEPPKKKNPKKKKRYPAPLVSALANMHI